MDLASVDRSLADLHRDRRWIIAAEVSAGAAGFVKKLDEWGAAGSIVVAAAPGVGDQPDTEVVFTGVEQGGTMMDAMRAFFRSVTEPTAEVLEAVDRFDPDRQAIAVIPDVHSTATLFGRPVYGDRGLEVQALEDKMLVDELWDAAGVARAPSEIVAVADAPAAADRLQNHLGSVWVADNRLGWHGGGNYARWIGVDDDPAEAVAWFSECAHRVRVMPFLDGLPCSIHGFSAPNGVAAFRPVEMVTLRRTGDTRGFLYGGVATFWDPEEADREAMREVARRVAGVLSERVGYRGPFSVDGVMTADGFLPTELNPRMSAGMGQLASTVEGLALGSLVRAAREGDMDIDPAWLESVVVEAADAQRTGGAYTVVQGAALPERAAEDCPLSVVFENGRLRRADEDEATGTVTCGDNPAGAYVRLSPDPERVPAGPSIGPMAVALMAFLEEEWGLEVGPVEAAPDLRKRTTPASTEASG